MERDRMQYARELKDYMVKHGMNQTMFADLVGCKNQSVSNWLRAFRIPTGELKKKVDAILDGEKKEGEKEVSLAKNGSGYYDPTAHNAFKNIISESKPECLRGDIYTVELKNMQAERKVLVIGNDYRKTDRWISVLLLQDEEKGKNVVPIVAGSMMYVDCDRVTYIDRNNVQNYVRTATAEEMAKIDEAICESLSISTSDAELYNKFSAAEEYLCKAKEENGLLKKEIENLERQLRSLLNKQPSSHSEDFIRLTAMLEIYKEQNEMLLEKLIG